MIREEDIDRKALQRAIDATKNSLKERAAAEEAKKPKTKIIRRGLSDTRRKKLSIRNRRRRNNK
jgi:hypothetical protein